MSDVDVNARLIQAAIHLVRPLVTQPDEVQAQVRPVDAGGLEVVVTVHPDDVGRVIGRQGKMIRNLRTIIALAERTLGTPATLEIVG